MADKTYIAIDLKSFYASVECVERGLDPLTTNLVVADASRTEKTICLAVSPSLKAYGISGRARLFEVVERVKQVNAERQRHAPDGKLCVRVYDDREVRADPGVALDYIVAKPQMAHYMEVSTKIYNLYLRYVAPEDIHVYSIDEVFIDATGYLGTYRLTARDFARKLMGEVLRETGVTATAGIGPNLYLAKVAMDVDAKHIAPDENGVRISELTERSYRERLWNHRPLTDFWRVGRGYAKKLEAVGLHTMGDIARCSLGGERDYYNEDLLYEMFGVNAELLIDHAWGWEPCTIADIKAYKPESNSISAGQVLQCPYDFDKARLIVHEMADSLSFDLVAKGLVADQIVLTVGYDIENLNDAVRMARYKGAVTTDWYGRRVPKSAHGSENLGRHTASTKRIVEAALALYNRIVDKNLLVRRMYVVANHVMSEAQAEQAAAPEQFSLFDAPADTERDSAVAEKEKRIQQAMLGLRQKYGKNTILRGMNYEEGATGRDRNSQIGGHRA